MNRQNRSLWALILFAVCAALALVFAASGMFLGAAVGVIGAAIAGGYYLGDDTGATP